MRPSAVVFLAVALIACSNQAPSPASASPVTEAQTKAADLRTRLDLLLAEHVMIVAKESAAAVNHSDEYAAYTTLLTTNAADLSSVIGRAFGSTASAQFNRSWATQNGLLVDYAIGVVTHNDDKANASMSGLTGTFTNDFAQLVGNLSGLSQDAVKQLAREQIADDKAFIDDGFGQSFASQYVHLHASYMHAALLGDALASRIARDFPDRFPGDPSVLGVDLRVSFNLLLQEHAYLATMTTDSVVGKRAAEKSAAESALASNAVLLSAAFARLYGTGASAQLDRLWAARDRLLIDYASGADTSSDNLTQTFVSAFPGVAHVDRVQVQRQLVATVRVIDDQKAKAAKTLADDDRAAATAMQPIADSIQG